MRMFLALTLSFFLFSVLSFFVKQIIEIPEKLTDIEKKCLIRCEERTKNNIILKGEDCLCLPERIYKNE